MSSWLAFSAAFDGPEFSPYICPAAVWALLKITSLVRQENPCLLLLPLPQLLLLLNNASVLSESPFSLRTAHPIVCPGVASIKCIKTPISCQRLAGSHGICMAARCPTGSCLLPADFVDFRVQRVQSLARPQDIEVLPAAAAAVGASVSLFSSTRNFLPAPPSKL